MTRILLVEDEDRLARSIAIGLRDEGYVVDRAADGEEALWYASSQHHDAIVLDLRLPRIGGLEVCERLRASGSSVPILMLTASDSTSDVVTGLDMGADDYMTKPFEFDELLARLRALVRRGTKGASASLSVGGLELDVSSRRVWRRGKEVELTKMEFRLLEFLVLHEGRVQSRSRIAAALWEDELGPESNVVEVLVSNLRRKLELRGDAPLLHTRRGEGYMIRGDEA